MEKDPVLKASTNACLCDPGVFCVHVCLCQPNKRNWLSAFMYLGVIENNTLFVVICVTSHVSVHSVCASGTHAHLHYWLNLHTGKKQLHSSTCSGPQGTVLGCVARQEGYLDQSSWERQPCSRYLLTFLNGTTSALWILACFLLDFYLFDCDILVCFHCSSGCLKRVGFNCSWQVMHCMRPLLWYFLMSYFII